jgi:hypothetical protein
MKGVFSKPYVCLDQYSDPDKLLNLVGDINYGIAKSHAHIRANYIKVANNVASLNTSKDSPKDFATAYDCWLSDTDPERKARGLELLETDKVAFEYWLAYEYKVQEYFTYLILRDYEKPQFWDYEPCDGLKENNFNFYWTEASKNFSSLRAWAETLPFKKMGPIFMLLKTTGNSVPMHQDLFFGKDDYNHQEHFMWFDPLKLRHLYIQDEVQGVRHKISGGVSYYWNNHDLHGDAEPVKPVSWTIRIEGIFEDWLVKELSS